MWRRRIPVMTVQRPPAVGQTRASLAPAAPLPEQRQGVHPLGEALKERAADVVDLTVARASGLAIDPALELAVRCAGQRPIEVAVPRTQS